MLHLLFIILKSIGIILLAILILAVAVISALLFVPLRYKGELKKYEGINAMINLSWFMHIISVTFEYETQSIISIKIFGIRLEAYKNTINKIKSFFAKKDKKPQKEKKDNKKELTEIQKEEKDNVKELTEIQKEEKDNVKELTEIQKEEKDNIKELTETQKEETNNAKELTKVQKEEDNKEQLLEIKNKTDNEAGENASKSETEISIIQKDEALNKKEKGLAHKLRQAVAKVKNLIKSVFDTIIRIFNFIKSIPFRIKQIFNQIREKENNAKEKIKSIKAFINDESNKKAFHYIKSELLAILKYIMPVKLRGRIKFGFDDPSITGQVLGVCGMLIPIYKDKISIYADFEQAMLEGEIFIKGRIRLYRFVLTAIKLIRNENVMQLYKRFSK